MNQAPLLGGVTGRLRALPKTTFRDPSAVELLEQGLRAIEDEFQRYDGFMTFVKILMEENNFVAAEKVIRTCPDFSEHDQGEFLGKLGRQLALSGQTVLGMEKLEEASTLLLTLEIDEWGWAQAERLVEIAKHYIALEESLLATTVLIKATSLCQKVLQKSIELNDLQNTHDSVSVLGDVGRVFVRLGEPDRAKQIADSLTQGMWRNFYLSVLESRIDELP
jgi:hypothetical protein